MIVQKHSYPKPLTCRTLYVVKCDKCGGVHQGAEIMADDSVRNAQLSGWHVPSLFPEEDFLSIRVLCPECRSD